MTLIVLPALAFLGLLIVLAVVALRLLGARDEQGRRSAPGCLAGCATAVVLALLGLLGLVVFVAATALVTPSDEMRSELRGAARELGDGLRELGDELRDGAEDLRRELRPDGERATRRQPRREAEPSSEPSPSSETSESTRAPLAGWRARVVVSWPGADEPRVELLEALASAGLEEPIELSVATRGAETDGPRTRATATARTHAAGVDELRREVEAALARLGQAHSLEFSTEAVADDELR